MDRSMLLAMAQLDFTVGDVKANLAKIADVAEAAYRQGIRILVTPELALSGYPVEDLITSCDFFNEIHDALRQLASLSNGWQGMLIIIGHPDYRCSQLTKAEGLSYSYCDNIDLNKNSLNVFNRASLIVNGSVRWNYDKRILPNYGVFDEKRYFSPGSEDLVFEWFGIRCGLLICEDIWNYDCAKKASVNADFLVVMNASPFFSGKLDERISLLSQRAYQNKIPLIYINLVGAQDELVFDGASMIFDGQGKMVYRAPCFQECIVAVQLTTEFNGLDKHATCHFKPSLIPFDSSYKNPLLCNKILSEQSVESTLYSALMLGLSSYVLKNGFTSVLLGLSGGVDSALVATLATDALGAENVRTIMMPSSYTSKISLDDSYTLAKTLGVKYQVVSIEHLLDLFKKTLATLFEEEGQFCSNSSADNHVEENLQARIRAVLLMALSNKYGSLLLSTGNKSELAVGYCTLYGDMAGAFSPIKDVNKSMVYRLCRYRNGSELKPPRPFPERILTRAPSAELRPNQLDEDCLPPYDILDKILDSFVVQNFSLDKICSMGFKLDQINQVADLIQLSEYKRRQAPIGTKVSRRAFGRDWRFPLTSRFLISRRAKTTFIKKGRE